jgi:hypothetical protein
MISPPPATHVALSEALVSAFAGIDPQHWPALDLTDLHHAARRTIFARCPRIEVTMKSGEIYIAHRLALHGMTPWRGESHAPGRTIVYFRTPFADTPDWLSRP